ncbi:MAG: hypothetical protein IIC91_01150 [Chloroflexi bacterium]|nr:hypothetical protein [Chloroflexota bacterium]
MTPKLPQHTAGLFVLEPLFAPTPHKDGAQLGLKDPCSEITRSVEAVIEIGQVVLRAIANADVRGEQISELEAAIGERS